MAALARQLGKSYFQCQTTFLQRICRPSYIVTRDFVDNQRDGSIKPGVPIIKRPLPLFIQFFKDTHPSLKTKFPGMKTTELCKQAIWLYQQLPEEEKNVMREDYKKRCEEFKVQLDGLSPLEKEELKAMQEAKKKSRALRARRKLNKDSGKPMRIDGYKLFTQEHLRKGDSLTGAAMKWQNLDPQMKEGYITKGNELAEEYFQKMKIWEQKMIKEGHPEVVRKKELPKQLKPKPKKVNAKKATKKATMKTKKEVTQKAVEKPKKQTKAE